MLMHDYCQMFFTCFSDVVDSGCVVQWICSLSDRHLCRSRLSTSVSPTVFLLLTSYYVLTTSYCAFDEFTSLPRTVALLGLCLLVSLLQWK